MDYKLNDICKVPFGFIEIFENGDAYTCCKSYIKNGRIGNIFNQSFEDIINSDTAVKLRQSCLNKSYDMCMKELCMPNKDAFAFLLESLYVGELDYSEKIKYPKIIKFSYDLDCNINCKSCRAKIYRNSKEYAEELDEKARKYFLPIIKYADKVCLIGSGDPFASKHTRNFIKMIAGEYPNIKFDLHTNGLLLNEKTLTELNIIDKLSHIQISIHASKKETYDKIVLNGNFNILMKNLEFVANLKKQDKVENIFLFFVVSKVNLEDAKEFVNLAKKYFAECFFWNLRDWGTEYTKTQMPDEYEIYKVFRDDIFNDKIVHLNPYLFNIKNNQNFLEDYFIKKINELKASNMELKDKINGYDERLDALNYGMDNIINSLAWFIPIRKWRDKFREKFKMTGQDRTGQDRTGHL